MMTDTLVFDAGMKTLVKNLGPVEAERFVMIVQREPFDYTRWSTGLFEDIPLDELNHRAMTWQKQHFAKEMSNV
jgi:hypothetical protein